MLPSLRLFLLLSVLHASGCMCECMLACGCGVSTSDILTGRIHPQLRANELFHCPPPHLPPLLFISFRLKLSLNSCVCSSQSPASSQLEASSSSLGVFLLSVAASWRRLARRQWGGCGGAGGRGGSVHCVNVISLQAGCA